MFGVPSGQYNLAQSIATLVKLDSSYGTTLYTPCMCACVRAHAQLFARL